MKALLVCLLVGATCLPCMGAETFIDTQPIGEAIWDGIDGSSNTTAAWLHNVPLEAIGNITAASLTIDVEGVLQYDPFFSPADDHVSIYLNGTHLGDLTGLQTTFNGSKLINALTAPTSTAFASIQWLGASAAASAAFDIDRDDYDAATIVTSTLRGEYISAVPAPSAILLAGLGTTLVGFLRKRA